ncbi:MAG: aminotransferase class V-fold PLP-dependent enzyme [Alphaproteobacteria bacterium]
MSENNFKDDFPIFSNNPDVIYLDSAATSQKPKNVLLKEEQYKEFFCANAKRGSYEWSSKVDFEIEKSRINIAKLINASSPNDIVFTSGATMSLNLVALCWAAHNLKSGDEIMLCEKDHKSMVLPFKNLPHKIKIVPYNLDVSGKINLSDIKSKITPQTKLINVTHIHNVAGVENDLAAIKAMLPQGCALNIDAAQSVSHTKIDVQAFGADFVSFSGHKMFATTGIGALWVNPIRHNEFFPVLFGGEQKNGANFYEKIECGTPNIGGIISLGEAASYIIDTGIETISQSILNLSSYMFEKFLSHPRINLVYPTRIYNIQKHFGILAFTLDDFEASDVGEYLSQNNVCVRHGLHCNNSSENKESIRISLQLYNTKDDVDRAFELIKKLIDYES